MTEPTAKTPGANAESAPLNLRAPHDVIARLTRVASKLPPGLFSKHRLAVLALEHGLAVIERDPMILLRGPASGPVVTPVEPPLVPVVVAPEAPAVAVVPVEPAPAARAEHAARPPRVAPVPVSPPAVDPRQLPLTPAASDAPMSESARPHESLRARYTDARERLRFTHDDATRALATAGVPVENLRRELVKPTDQWTAAHAAALAVWLDTIEANGAPAASEPAAAPRRARGKAVATPENDALRARYTAALAAKQLTNKPTAARVGCSEGTLHQWQVGDIKNLGGDKDREGKWLTALASILDALPPPLA